jgi:hypothetical protein
VRVEPELNKPPVLQRTTRQILAEILEGVPNDEQAKIAGGNIARVCNFDVARLTAPALGKGPANAGRAHYSRSRTPSPPCTRGSIGSL